MDNFDVLGQGQVPTAGSDFYLVPAAKHAALRYISLILTTATATKIDLYVNDNTGAIAKLWRHVELGVQYDGWEWDGALMLGTGDRLWGKADQNNTVNFVVCGVVGDPV